MFYIVENHCRYEMTQDKYEMIHHSMIPDNITFHLDDTVYRVEEYITDDEIIYKTTSFLNKKLPDDIKEFLKKRAAREFPAIKKGWFNTKYYQRTVRFEMGSSNWLMY